MKHFRIILSVLLAAMMTVSSFSVGAFASNTPGNENGFEH